MKARHAEPGTEATLALLARLRSYNDRPIQTDGPRTNPSMGQLSNMLQREAECISNKLFDASIQRVAQRQSMQLEAAA